MEFILTCNKYKHLAVHNYYHSRQCSFRFAKQKCLGGVRRALCTHGGLTGGNAWRPASSGVNTSLSEQEKQDCKVCVQRGARVRRLKGVHFSQ